MGDSLTYGSARVLLTLVGALLVPIYTRVLSRADYGLIESFNSLAAVALLILPCGLMQAVYRFAPASDETEARRTYSTTFTFLFAVCLIFLTASIVFRREATVWLVQDAAWIRVYVLTAVSIVLAVLSGYNLEVLRSRFQKTSYLVLSVGSAILLGSLGILFVASQGLGVEGFFLAAVITQGVAVVAGTFVNRSWLRLSIDPTRLWELLRFGLPFVPTAVTLVLMRFGDRLIVQRLLGLDDLGLYAIGVRVAGVYALVGSAFATAWFPHAMRSLQDVGHQSVLGKDFTRVFWLLALVAGAFCSVADWLVWALVDPKFWVASAIVPPLVLASLFQTLNYPLGIGIYASKRTAYVLIPTLLGSLAGLTSCYLLAQQAGLPGVALSVVIGASVYLTSSFAISHRLYPIAYDLRRSAAILLALVVWLGALQWSSAGAIEPSIGAAALRTTLLIGMLVLGSALGVAPRVALPARFRR